MSGGFYDEKVERMKRQLRWTLRLHARGAYDNLRRAVVHPILEHQFNNHEHFGDWCKAKEGAEAEVSESCGSAFDRLQTVLRACFSMHRNLS
jgi:hypothetical protein